MYTYTPVQKTDMYAHVYIIYIYIYKYTQTCIHTHLNGLSVRTLTSVLSLYRRQIIYAYVDMHACVTHTHIYMYTHIHNICMYIHTSTNIYAYVDMHACVTHTHTYIYT